MHDSSRKLLGNFNQTNPIQSATPNLWPNKVPKCIRRCCITYIRFCVRLRARTQSYPFLLACVCHYTVHVFLLVFAFFFTGQVHKIGVICSFFPTFQLNSFPCRLQSYISIQLIEAQMIWPQSEGEREKSRDQNRTEIPFSPCLYFFRALFQFSADFLRI